MHHANGNRARLFLLCSSQPPTPWLPLLQDTVDDLKVQLFNQQQAASDTTQALAAREEELQRIKASSTTEVQAWQAKADELKQVGSMLDTTGAQDSQGPRDRQHSWLCLVHMRAIGLLFFQCLSCSTFCHAWRVPNWPVMCCHSLVCLQANTTQLQELQTQLDQAYNDLSELQYSSDQDKAALEAQVQALQEQLHVSRWLLFRTCTLCGMVTNTLHKAGLVCLIGPRHTFCKLCVPTCSLQLAVPRVCPRLSWGLEEIARMLVFTPLSAGCSAATDSQPSRRSWRLYTG